MLDEWSTANDPARGRARRGPLPARMSQETHRQRRRGGAGRTSAYARWLVGAPPRDTALGPPGMPVSRGFARLAADLHGGCGPMNVCGSTVRRERRSARAIPVARRRSMGMSVSNNRASASTGDVQPGAGASTDVAASPPGGDASRSTPASGSPAQGEAPQPAGRSGRPTAQTARTRGRRGEISPRRPSANQLSATLDAQGGTGRGAAAAPPATGASQAVPIDQGTLGSAIASAGKQMVDRRSGRPGARRRAMASRQRRACSSSRGLVPASRVEPHASGDRPVSRGPAERCAWASRTPDVLRGGRASRNRAGRGWLFATPSPFD